VKLNRNQSTTRGMMKCGALMQTALLMLATMNPSASAATKPKTTPTAKTPIKHVVIIIGENRTFDHVYGTYVPRSGQTIWNLQSEGIVNLDGTPGPNFKKAQQYKADVQTSYEISPTAKAPYTTLPPSVVGGPEGQNTWTAPFASEAVGKLVDPDLADDYNKYLTTGYTGQKAHSGPDTRITNSAAPANGPYQLTGPKMPYDAYTSSPVHRLFQMWQQTDCSKASATAANPSGCLNDLFPWVEVTIGAGSNGLPLPAKFSTLTTGEGSTSMAFYNMYEGDAPYFKYLADNYTINDNFHQAVMGGTGANHIMFGFGDAIYYENASFGAATPPANEIEDADPQEGTNNWYKEDGYGDGGFSGSPAVGGGSYVNCSAKTTAGAAAPEGGVPAVTSYLESIDVKPNCENGHYYLVNNYNPGYFPNGDAAPITGSNPLAYAFTIPPTSQKSIADEANAAGLSIKYFGEQFDLNAEDPAFLDPTDEYCNICNPFEYSANIMANPETRVANNADEQELFEDIDAGTLPAVSIVKPSGDNDGHPASSKLDLFEGFTKKIVEAIQANPTLWESTAIFITFDEGGGYWDSGYIQPVDFFGDGTRIPLIVVSPYSAGGKVAHEYGDHVSLDKFIEYNWGLKPITVRSRDNFPNPKQPANKDGSPSYAPTNGPALADLTGEFDWKALSYSVPKFELIK